MGRKLDALLRRTFKPSEFKTFLNLAISRLAVLKNQRQVRCSHARSDVAQLLELGRQEQALLQVDHVIKEQNMFDAFVMMERYCYVLIERVSLIENQKDCPHELKEPISGLIFTASRCGEFPELQKIREIFTSRFGKEFTASAVELRNQCGVNPKIIQKMSTRQASLDIRLKVTKEIASEKGISLNIDESMTQPNQEVLNMIKHTGNQVKHTRSDVGGNTGNSTKYGSGDDVHNTSEIDLDNEISESVKSRKKYVDVASAAQAAFEAAAYAAAAARAAVELSRLDSHDKDSDDQSSPGSCGRKGSDINRDNDCTDGWKFGKTTHSTHQHSSSESDDQELKMDSGNFLKKEFIGQHNFKDENGLPNTQIP